MRNIEIKARYSDLSRAREIAKELGGNFLWKDQQVDTYFTVARGKLKLRESGLNGAELLPYLKRDDHGHKRSDYAKLPVAEPDVVRGLLDELLGRKLQVRKTREVYLVGNVRVHLDEVEGLSTFLELEAVVPAGGNEAAEHAKVRTMLDRFGVPTGDLLEGSYPDMLA